MKITTKQINIISLVFFISGVSALAFETVWFRIASLVLGSSIWSAAAVLMAFMTGLGIGNVLIAWNGHKLKNPITFYVVLEIIIAVTGVLSVLLLPLIIPVMAGLVADISDNSSLLNLSRFTLAFLAFLIPAVAMGATLPVLQKILYCHDQNFARSFARLYSWNTLGAVLGTLLAQFYLITLIGITGTALVASLLNFMAAFILLRYIKTNNKAQSPVEVIPFLASLLNQKYLLIAPFMTGLILLALEIIWFRYLLLIRDGTSTAFAIMLANILTGIGVGGYIATKIVSRTYNLDKTLKILILLSASSVVGGFYLFQLVLPHVESNVVSNLWYFFFLAAILMLPTSILTGILFPLFAEKLFRRQPEITRASGLITFVNTIGAALGSGLATFLLLPLLGIEISIFVLTLSYFLVYLLIQFTQEHKQAVVKQMLIPIISLGVIISVFPFGSLDNLYVSLSNKHFPTEKLIKVKEGLNETLRYYKQTRFGETLSHRLVTNNHSMSTTTFTAKRYMKLYAYFPYVMHNNIKDVLLISYGIGNTAEAITRLNSVKRFDVVDISKDILTLSSIIHNDTGWFPLQDKRTQVHIEDGRFFLQTTPRRYDLITGEPPPPVMAGVVNLYSEEYFKLLKSKLNPGGIVTYWLPVHNLHKGDTLSIIKAFCSAFSDCSLWNGAAFDYMLVGSNGGIDKVSIQRLNKIWDSNIGEELKLIGLEEPGQLATTFMADSKLLSEMTTNSLPVTDNFPHRIMPRKKGVGPNYKLNLSLINVSHRRERFKQSAYIASLFPKELKTDFNLESILFKTYFSLNDHTKAEYWNELNYLLTKTKTTTLPLLYLYSSPREQAIVNGLEINSDPEYLLAMIKGRLVEREYEKTSSLLKSYLDTYGDELPNLSIMKLYYLAKALNNDLTMQELIDVQVNNRSDTEYASWGKYVTWITKRFSISPI